MSRQFNFVFLTCGLLMAAFVNPAEAVTIAGISFDDDAFADIVVSATPSGSGQFAKETLVPSSLQFLTLPADFAILEAAVIGADLNQWISLRSSDARLTVGFTDLVPIDGPGDDIAIIEIGATAPIDVTISGVTLHYTSQTSSTPGTNFVFIDLGDFGVSQTSSITMASTSILNDIAAIGAINSVPEPSTLVLAGIAATGFGVFGRRGARPVWLNRAYRTIRGDGCH